ncbi:MAG TPA: hypothetical protein VLB01_07735 [Thermodesulfobacteriota bacterium]|nr:hypothetical protein [Thermodesulfobacteriota bacterium]
MQKSMIIIYLVCAVLVFGSTQISLAQYMYGATPNPPPVRVPGGLIAGPLIENNGIVKPLTSLDVFQYSSLESNGSTLGERLERRSNIEINNAIRDRARSLQVEGQEFAAEVSQTQTTEEESTSEYIPLPPSETPMYVWTDKSGVIHITNSIDSVPPEYRNKARKGGE